MRKNEDIYQLYKKFLENKCSKDEQFILFEYINSNDFLDFIPNDIELQTELELPSSDKILRKVKKDIGLNKKTLKISVLFKYAAAIILFLISSMWIKHSTKDKEQTIIFYSVGKQSELTLADGTTVFLSANSTLQYPKVFSDKTREVNLYGEAFFDVAHNPSKAFIVHTSSQTVKVLGTSFNIKEYPNESKIETTLITGSIELSYGDKKALLKPNQQAILSEVTMDLSIDDTDVDMFMAWKTGKYIFKNKSFGEIASVLEKGFGVQIIIKNNKLKNKLYTMRFENNESLEKILDLIKVNGKFEYKYENGNIIIK